MKLNCCVANGPRGQFTLPFTTAMSMKGGISINFFVDGTYELKTPSGKKIVVNQKTDYPVSGNVEFVLNLNTPEEMVVRIRIPSWSTETELKINGSEIKNIRAGEYAEIKKTWSPNDKILLKLDMHGRLETEGTDHKYAAIVRGPIVLCRDTRLPGTNLGKVITPIKDAKGYIQLTSPDIKKGNAWMEYVASFLPESYTEEGPSPIRVPLCDYASGGNGKEPSTFQVWMPQLYDPREV